METTVKQTGAMSRLTAERLLSKAADGKPETLLDEYEKAARAVDEARARLEDQKAINESLARQLKVTKDEAVALKIDLDKTKSEAASSEKDAREASRLRARVTRLEELNDLLKPKAKELERLLDTTEGSAAAALARKYERTWWVAVIACGASVLLTLGLIATYANAAPQPPLESPEPTPAPPPHAEPPHQIT
jgi:ATP-dependent Lon protease